MRVHVLRCDRCNVCFIVEGHWNSGRYGEGEKERMEILEANPCSACSKGSVDRLGYFDFPLASLIPEGKRS